MNGDCLIIVSPCIFHPLSELCVGIPSILEQMSKPKNTLKGLMIHFLFSSSPCITSRPCFLSFSTLLILSEPTWSPCGECHLTNPHQVWSLTSSSGLCIYSSHCLKVSTDTHLNFLRFLLHCPPQESLSWPPYLNQHFPLCLLVHYPCLIFFPVIYLHLILLYYFFVLLFITLFIYLLMPAASLQHRSCLIAEVFVFCSCP